MKAIISIVLRKVPRHILQKFAHKLLPLAGLANRGSDVECPVCDAKYSRFLTYGRLKPRENALCPSCLALERHRLMWLYLKEQTDFFSEPKKLLHIAPEYCFLDRFKKQENLDYVTGDLISPLADVHFDVHDIPFEDNSFDIAFCNHVMEHVEDDVKAMSEICRVLRPGGWAFIQSPQDYSRQDTYEDPTITDPKDREEHFWQDDHVRLFGMDYGKRLEQAGFSVEEDHWVMKLPEERVKKHALPGDEIIYFCRKPAAAAHHTHGTESEAAPVSEQQAVTA
ncbi:MAG: methyltransferase domain-containing protein [Verrucomicrobiota bacterium]